MTCPLDLQLEYLTDGDSYIARELENTLYNLGCAYNSVVATIEDMKKPDTLFTSDTLKGRMRWIMHEAEELRIMIEAMK